MKLFAREFGEGRPVIILHGLFGSSDNWMTFGKRLAMEGFRVILIDLRNHGQSPHSPEFDFALLRNDVRELMDDMGIGSAVIIGHSLGGKTAMTLAFENPNRIEHLIVVDISLRFYPVHHRGIIDVLSAVDFSRITNRSEVEAILETEMNDPVVVQFFLKNLFWKEKNRLAWRFNLNAISENIEEVGKSVYPDLNFNRPSMFIKGENSSYITYDDEREIFEYFSNVEVRTAPGAGHWVHADQPDWLLNTVVKKINATE